MPPVIRQQQRSLFDRVRLVWRPSVTHQSKQSSTVQLSHMQMLFEAGRTQSSLSQTPDESAPHGMWGAPAMKGDTSPWTALILEVDIF